MTEPYPVGVIRVVVTPDETPPGVEAWRAGEPADDSAAALELARRLADAEYTAGRIAFVWVGHNGVYVPGLWKWWARIPPPGWTDPETERQERDTAAWFARKMAEAEAARDAKRAAAVARRASAEPYRPRDTSMDAIR